MVRMFTAKSLQILGLAAVVATFTAVPGAAQTLQLGSTMLTFEAEVGAPSPPSQSFTVATPTPGQAFSASVKATIIGTSFLSLFPTNGTTPGEVSVSVNAAQFTQPGTRTADIEVVLSGTGERALVRVEVNVNPPSAPPVVATAPPSLFFAVSSAGSLPPPQPLVVSNDGAGIMSYELGVIYPASGPQGWLAVSPPNGTVTFNSKSHQVSVSATAGLPEGDYTAQLVVTGNASNAPFIVPVTLTVGAAPNISVNPTTFSFTASEGGALPAIQTLTVRNEGGGDLNYTIAGDQDWLRVRPLGGDASAAPMVHDVLPDTRGLPQGTYTGNLVITSDDIGTPLRIPVTLTIGPPSRLFTLPTSIDFVAPAGLPHREQRLISVVNSPLAPGNWTARIEPDHITWARLTPTQGDVPGHLTVDVDTSGLGAAPLNAEIVIEGRETAAALGRERVPQGPAEARIPLRLTLLQRAPQLGATPGALLFEGAAGEANILERVFQVDNTGGPQLQWTAEVETEDGEPWLAINPGSGVAPTRTRATANTAGLAPGVRHGRVLLKAGDQEVAVPVVLVVRDRDPSVTTGRTSFYWETNEGGPNPAPVSVRVFNPGTGTASWRARILETTGGASWLGITPSSGTARTADSGVESILTLTPNPQGLAPGVYGALVELREAASDKPPHVVSAVMRVSSAGLPALRTVDPGGMTFVGSGPLIPQEARFRRNVSGATEFRAAKTELKGSGWLSIDQTGGQTDADGVASLEVSVDSTGLLPDTYRGLVSVTFGDGLVRSAWVTLVVPTDVPGSCRATAVALAPISPHLGFRAIAGRATQVEAELLDNCGRRLQQGSVLARFNNDDRPLALEHVGAGRYAATWSPGNAGSQANIALIAASGPFSDRLVLMGAVEGSQAPRLSVSGVVGNAGFPAGRAIAPGGIVSTFGRGLSPSGNAPALSTPLPDTLATTSLGFGGRRNPLYFVGLQQIDSQAPVDLAPNRTTHAVARVGGDYTVPERVAVASAAPGLYVAVRPDFSVITAENPALRGEAITVFLQGIGAVDPPVASGETAPGAEPLARASLPFSTTLAGQPAETLFLGLTPNFVGLGQANVLIPSDAPLGAVELRLSVDGHLSNSLTIHVAEAP